MTTTHAIWAFSYADPLRDGPRRVITVTDVDYRRWQLHRFTSPGTDDPITVVDLTTGDTLEIRQASCGLECHCAASWRTVTSDQMST